MTNCIDCLKPLQPGERVVVATLQEDGVIHGVRYPAGAVVKAHERCVRVVLN